MSFTFDQLKTAIQDYTENDETTFVNNLSLFIRQAEERILKSVQLSLFRKNATASTTASNKFLACPGDFLAPFSLSLAGTDGDKFFIDFKDPSFLQTYTPDSTTTGSPRYYAVFDVGNFILAPTPNTTFTAELHYFYRPASITAGASDGTTWLSTNASNALLYACLLEGYIYMKGEPDLLQIYDGRYKEALARLKNLGEAENISDSYREGTFRVPQT